MYGMRESKGYEVDVQSSYARALVEVQIRLSLVDICCVIQIPFWILKRNSCPMKPQEAKRSSFDDNDDVVAPACGKTKTDSAKSYEDTNNVKSPIDSTDPGFHSDDIDLGELKSYYYEGYNADSETLKMKFLPRSKKF
ncbi:hypothetical protein Tco_0115968 [Tanacetum coccineum]